MILDFSIKYIYIYIYKTHTHTQNIKNRKLNCSLYTKKTNNFNKLMKISYHLAIIKIQKLQN